MKKIFSIAIAALLGVLGMSAQTLPSNVNANVLKDLSPAPGTVSLDVNESGLLSFSFNIAEANSKINTGANVYCTLSRDGEVVSNVQACNNIQITYDGVYADIWNLAFFLDRTPLVTMGGNYQIKFDEGFFLLGDAKTPSPEILLNYYIKGDDYYITPAPENGKQWESLHEFTLTIPGAERITAEETKVIEIYNVYGAGATEDDDNPTLQNPDYRIEGNSVIITTKEPITDPGTWYLVIPEDMFTASFANGTDIKTPYIMSIYLIPNHGGGLPNVEPEPGEVEDFPGVISLELQKGCELIYVNDMGWNYLYPIDDNGNRGNFVARFRGRKSATRANVVELVYYDEKLQAFDPDALIVPAPGKYELYTSPMLYRVRENGSDHSVSAMSFFYDVYVYDELPMTITPASGSTVSEIKQIKFEIESAKEIKVFANNRKSATWLSDGVTNYIFNPFVSADAPNTVVLNTPVLATLPGTYKLLTGAGQVVVDGVARILTADYTISDGSGVGEISNVVVLPEVFDVYNTQSILLKKNADVDYLRTLPAGIYVAGGKKYVVK